MAQVTFQGSPMHTVGDMPRVGTQAPDFVLTKTDLSDISMNDVLGKRIVMNIFPSVDTPVCAASVRRFNSDMSEFNNTVVLCISRDLPFEGIENVIPASELRTLDFGKLYGVRIIDGPLAGLLARAVMILDNTGRVIYRQLAPEIAEEPDYESVLRTLKETL
jgi:thiol peroxidase